MSAFNWTAKTSPNSGAFGVIGVYAGSGAMIAAWQDGTGQTNIATSADNGTTWTPQTVPTEVNTIVAMQFTNGLALLSTQGGTGDVLAGTSGGTVWNILASSITAGWGGVAPAAVGLMMDGSGDVVLLNFANPDVSVSNDNGSTFTPHLNVLSAPVVGFANCLGIYDGTVYASLGYDNSGNTYVVQSANGASGWTASAATNVALGQIQYNGAGQYVASTGLAGVVVASSLAGLVTAGLTSLASVGITSGGNAVSWDAVNSLWVCVDSLGNTAYSSDGATWFAGDPLPSGASALAQSTPGPTGVTAFGLGDGSVAISSYVSAITVPDLTGLTQAAAVVALNTVGLNVGSVSSAINPGVAAGLVFTQNPIAGTSVSGGSAVSFVVSLGPPEVTVPNLIGLTAAAAEAALSDVGLTTGAITGVTSDSVPIGDVATQSPAAGTEVTQGSAVAIGIAFVSPVFDIDATVISQYANSPTIVALVEDFGQWFDPSQNIQNFYLTVWNIDTAQGFGLDIWGVILGVSRVIPIPGDSGAFGFDNSDSPPDWENFGNPAVPAAGGPFFSGQISGNSYRLDDNSYRVLLLTKALANICATTAPALNALITNLFPGRGVCYTVDRGNMAMSYVFTFPLTSIEFAILSFSGVLPHPAGVLVDVLVIQTGFFGFAEAGPDVVPFDFGTFFNGG